MLVPLNALQRLLRNDMEGNAQLLNFFNRLIPLLTIANMCFNCFLKFSLLSSLSPK